MTTQKVYDLSHIDTVVASNKGAEFELVHPITQAKMGMFISVVGKDSDIFREFQRTAFNRYMREEAMAKKRGKDAKVRSAEELEDDSLTLLVSCTTGWRNIVVDGKEVPYSDEEVGKLYKKYPWVRDQVNEAIGDLELFMKG